MSLLGGIESKAVRGKRKKGGSGWEEVEKEITEKDVERALGKLKDGKSIRGWSPRRSMEIWEGRD